ncbi:MAG: hypothetical protein ACRD0D_01715, partial [Acidimicrobiales bacterium]
MTRRWRERAPALESLFVGAYVLLGLRLGCVPIADNSMFVHLRTGIDMAGGGGIPRADPYSFTAAGEPWVVQSWLASWAYGLAERTAGVEGVVIGQGLLMAVLAGLVAGLARAGSPLRTALAGGIAVGLGATYWAPRPLLFGLVAFALTVTVVERGASPLWLLPIGWVWVNSHGSFPLGLAWVLLRAVGAGADGRRVPG